MLNRKELIIIEKCLDIKKSHKLSTNSLINLFRVFVVKKELYNLGLNKISKRYVSINQLDCIRKLNKLSHNTLKKLRKLQQITNYDSQSREDLIYAWLRSKTLNEDNHISRTTSSLDTSSLDNEIKEQTDDIKQLVLRLGNLLTNKERTRITTEINDILKKFNNRKPNTRLRKRQKDNLVLKLIEQHNSLSEKEQYMDLNYDDLHYQGISNIKHTLDNINIDSYY